MEDTQNNRYEWASSLMPKSLPKAEVPGSGISGSPDRARMPPSNFSVPRSPAISRMRNGGSLHDDNLFAASSFNGPESGSDSELEFGSSHGSSGITAPFEPKRCSTPLNDTSGIGSSFTDFSPRGDNKIHLNTYKRLYGGGGEMNDLPEFDRRSGRHSNTPLTDARRLPVPSSAAMLKWKNSAAGVPEFGSSSSMFSSASAAMVPLSGNFGSPSFERQYERPPAASSLGYGGRAGMVCCGPSESPLMMEEYGHKAGYMFGNGEASLDRRWPSENSVERQAQANRLAASICVPNVVWSGNLPVRNARGSAYSCKVFLGGVPWDITEANLNVAFSKFGQLKVEWPSTHMEHAGRNSKGYLYIIFDNERSVRALLSTCTQDFSNGNRNYYYKVCSNRLRRKDVQVIPWQLADSTYVRNGCISAFGTKTVFVGSLHGMLNAEGLARIMDDLFGGVVAANIDTDKHKYPIGSGRVVFNCTHSYVKAIRAAYVELRTQKFSKKIQIDPFLEDTLCSICNAQLGPFFCRDMECFNYFCGTCWQWQHSVDNLKHHKPLMRNPRTHDSEY